MLDLLHDLCPSSVFPRCLRCCWWPLTCIVSISINSVRLYNFYSITVYLHYINKAKENWKITLGNYITNEQPYFSMTCNRQMSKLPSYSPSVFLLITTRFLGCFSIALGWTRDVGWMREVILLTHCLWLLLAHFVSNVSVSQTKFQHQISGLQVILSRATNGSKLQLHP